MNTLIKPGKQFVYSMLKIYSYIIIVSRSIIALSVLYSEIKAYRSLQALQVKGDLLLDISKSKSFSWAYMCIHKH